MRNIFAASDHHFGHVNMLRFTDGEGNLIRGARFSCIEEHDETIIDNHNKIVTSDSDIVYFGGDVSFKPQDLGRILPRMRGRKRLIFGNHDPDVLRLMQFFQKAGIWRIFKEFGLVLSHFPLREDQFRNKVEMCGHGHTHQHLVKGPYANFCMEHTDYSPVALEDFPALMKKQQATL